MLTDDQAQAAADLLFEHWQEGRRLPALPDEPALSDLLRVAMARNPKIHAARERADVVLYLVRPTNGADPFMVSLPRDLYVENPCTKGNSRINTLIKGCPSKDINGPTLLSYQVGAITGIEVDHFAWFNFESVVSTLPLSRSGGSIGRRASVSSASRSSRSTVACWVSGCCP